MDFFFFGLTKVSSTVDRTD